MVKTVDTAEPMRVVRMKIHPESTLVFLVKSAVDIRV